MSQWIGHDQAERELLAALAGHRVPGAWLLAGPRGLGKAGFAHRAASFILADGDRHAAAGARSLDVSDAEPSSRLIAARAHAEYLLVERTGRDIDKALLRRPPEEDDGELRRNITIDQVRNLMARMRNRPAEGRWRSVIIDAIDDCEAGAANALLKTLEEPPDNTVFFLVTHAPGRLLPTIRSRCRMIRFAPIADDPLRGWLAGQMPSLAPADLDAAVAVAGGSPARALAAAAQGAGANVAALIAIASHGDRDNALRSQLSRRLSTAAERANLPMLLEQAEALAVDHARRAQGDALGRALAVRDRVRDIARQAIRQSEDPATVIFALGTAIAGLAPR